MIWFLVGALVGGMSVTLLLLWRFQLIMKDVRYALAMAQDAMVTVRQYFDSLEEEPYPDPDSEEETSKDPPQLTLVQ